MFTPEEQLTEAQLTKGWLSIRKIMLDTVMMQPNEVTIASALDTAFAIGKSAGRREGVAQARQLVIEELAKDRDAPF